MGDGVANAEEGTTESVQHYWLQDKQLGKQKENLCLLQLMVHVQCYSYMANNGKSVTGRYTANKIEKDSETHMHELQHGGTRTIKK